MGRRRKIQEGSTAGMLRVSNSDDRLDKRAKGTDQNMKPSHCDQTPYWWLYILMAVVGCGGDQTPIPSVHQRNAPSGTAVSPPATPTVAPTSPPTLGTMESTLPETATLLGFSDIRTIAPQPTTLLGRGYNTLRDDFRGDCVARAAAKTTFSGTTGGPSTTYRISYLEDASELRRQLGLSASASIGMGISNADASAKYYSSMVTTSQTSYLLVEVTVVNQSETLEEFVFTDYAKNMLIAKDYAGFLTLCGDRFVAARTTGGSLRGIFEFATTTAQQKQEIGASLRGSSGLFKGSAEFNSVMESISKKVKYEAFLVKQGGTGSVLPTTVEELKTLASQFESKVSGPNAKDAWVISATLADYGVVLPPLGQQIRHLDRERKSFRLLAKLHTDHRLRANELAQVAAWSKNVECQSYATEVGGALKSYAESLRELGQDCYENASCTSISVPPPIPMKPFPKACEPVTRCTVPLTEFARENMAAGGRETVRCGSLTPGAKVFVRLSGMVVPHNLPSDFDTWVCFSFGGKFYCNEGGFGCPSSQDGCSGRGGARQLTRFNLDTVITVPSDGVVEMPLTINRCTARAVGDTTCGIRDGRVTFEVVPDK